MQSIELNNLIEKTRARLQNQQRIYDETKGSHDFAFKHGLYSVAKRLKSQLTRQLNALEASKVELRELEEQATSEGDLITPKKK